MSVEGLEIASESWKDLILDVAERLPNDVGRPERQAPWSRCWFIEAYRESYNGIELILAVRAGIGKPAYLRAVVIGTGVECGWLQIPEPTDGLNADNGDEQFSMLVADVEPMEDGKLVVRWLRSLVRLHLIEDFPQFLRDAGADLDADTAVAIGRGRNIKDREGRGFVGRSAACDDQLPCEMVKRDAKVVDGIADDRAQNGGDGGHAIEAKDVLGSLLIALSDNGLSARILDPLGSTVKIVQMGFCPLDLHQHARQVGAAHVLPSTHG
jgi:hypothetical protein